MFVGFSKPIGLLVDRIPKKSCSAVAITGTVGDVFGALCILGSETSVEGILYVRGLHIDLSRSRQNGFALMKECPVYPGGLREDYPVRAPFPRSGEGPGEHVPLNFVLVFVRFLLCCIRICCKSIKDFMGKPGSVGLQTRPKRGPHTIPPFWTGLKADRARLV